MKDSNRRKQKGANYSYSNNSKRVYKRINQAWEDENKRGEVSSITIASTQVNDNQIASK